MSCQGQPGPVKHLPNIEDIAVISRYHHPGCGQLCPQLCPVTPDSETADKKQGMLAKPHL